ncbi:S41 family peptidase [Gorillibacterium sp. sgz500922]|uniref:S41 family peptidase n=1 Tax=Gorillibacterium sp. sgz500922 TaxID=3446694 RepID=UPI003F665C12
MKQSPPKKWKHSLKKGARISAGVAGRCLLVIVLYATYQAAHLELWNRNTPSGVKALTKQEKREDFEYLTRYVRDVYPYNDAIVRLKSLEDLPSLEQSYIERAGLTESNAEFFQLVYEYTQRLRQGDGHIGVYFGGYRPANDSFLQAYFYNIKKSAYLKMDYWGKEAATFGWYAFSNADVVYSGGNYVLNREYAFPDITLPEGTVIEKVDGKRTDEYVNSLQSKTRLLFDAALNKNFIGTLFSIDSNTGSDHWTVDFRLKDGTGYTGKLMKQSASAQAEKGLRSSDYPNAVCRELDGETGYIKIFTFNGQYIESDHAILQNFLNDSKGKYKKLIIDIRGNEGGELTYWGENLVRPLLREPKTFVQYSAVRKGFFDRMGFKYNLYRWVMTNDLLQKDVYHIERVEKASLAEFDEKDWNVFKITKRFTPRDSVPFDGKVYILTDRDTFSAGDSFAAAAKGIKLGEVVGTSTGGSGSAFLAPVDIALPHSGILLKMNVELTLTDRNQPNQIVGTAPDVELPSVYPSDTPRSLETADLLADPWISWVRDQ